MSVTNLSQLEGNCISKYVVKVTGWFHYWIKANLKKSPVYRKGKHRRLGFWLLDTNTQLLHETNVTEITNVPTRNRTPATLDRNSNFAHHSTEKVDSSPYTCKIQQTSIQYEKHQYFFFLDFLQPKYTHTGSLHTMYTTQTSTVQTPIRLTISF